MHERLRKYRQARNESLHKPKPYEELAKIITASITNQKQETVLEREDELNQQIDMLSGKYNTEMVVYAGDILVGDEDPFVVYAGLKLYGTTKAMEYLLTNEKKRQQVIGIALYSLQAEVLQTDTQGIHDKLLQQAQTIITELSSKLPGEEAEH